jgi:hypothetical protein
MELSILVPARNEMFLTRTVEDILAHAEGDTEVIHTSTSSSYRALSGSARRRTWRPVCPARAI